jgi:thiol-disulfide isomerase/thioredoxin
MNRLIGEPSAAGAPGSRRSQRKRLPNRLLLATGLGLILVVWLFLEPLQNRIIWSVGLANPAPPPELVEEIIENSPNRTAAILAAWHTGKILHRQVAVRQISRATTSANTLPPELDSILVSAALDVDMNVRETAFGILNSLKHPARFALAAAQLADADPQVRLLGLNHLKQVEARIGLPIVLPLLDEADPFIVSMGLKLLEKWSGQDFGVKLSDTASFVNETSGLKEFRGSSWEKAKAGANRAKQWWRAHQSEFPSAKLSTPKEMSAARQPVSAGDFTLRALDGRQVRLSDFRNKVVLINFWTTWCTACVSEMPELIALQNRYEDKLAIIGISLDFVPDSHGHVGGHATVEEENQNEGHHEDGERNAEALKRVREKVWRTVKARGINYTVLLDEKNEIGGRFNGGELPTTVIIDAGGNVRRRFVGARSLPVFEAMIAEAARPIR